MEWFYLFLLLTIILLVLSIFLGVEFLISGEDYSWTRFFEFAVGTVVTSLFCIGSYISARIKKKKREKKEKTHNRNTTT